jgi:copper transport protein
MLKKLIYVGVILLYLVPIATVNAHSPIEKRIPETNAVLQTMPNKVELFFEEPVEIHRSSVIVRNDKEVEVQIGKPQLDPNDNRHIYVDLQKNLSSGIYTVDIDVVAVDGHPLKEKYQFEIKVKTSSNEEMFQRLILERAYPEDGTIIEKSPKKIELWYSEPAEMDVFGILDDKQQSISSENPIVDPNNPKHFIIEIKDELGKGTYSIHSQVQIGEQRKYDIVYFAVEDVSSITGSAVYSRDSIWKHIGFLQIAHWLAYIGLLTLFGGTWFQFIDKGKGDLIRWKKCSNYLYGLSIAALVLELLLNKYQFSEVNLKDFLSFNFVWISILQIVFLSVSYFINKDKIRFFILLLSVLCWALTGHSVAPNYGGAWGIVIDLLHLLAVSLWIGGLFALFIMMPKENSLLWLKETGKAFSKWALVSMIVIGITGVMMSLKYVPSFSLRSMAFSYWGGMLFFKIALFIGIVVFGLWQRKLLLRMTEVIANVFQRNMKIEIGIAVLVLFGAGILVDLSPKEAEQGIYPKTQVQQGIKATVNVSPMKPGANDISIQFDHESDIEKVRVKFYTTNEWSVENSAFSMDKGLYKLTGTFFHAAGTMNMEVQAIRTNGEKLIFPFKVQVPGVMPPNT